MESDVNPSGSWKNLHDSNFIAAPPTVENEDHISGNDLTNSSSESSTRGSSTSDSSSGCESEMGPKLKQGSRLLFNKEDNGDYLTEVEEAGESKSKRDGELSGDDSEEMVYLNGFYISKKNASTNTAQESVAGFTASEGTTQVVYYKSLYEESKQQMAEHLGSIKCANAKYDDDLEEIIIKDSENETSLHEKDKLVKSLQNTIVGYEVKLGTLASKQESKEKEYEDRLRTEVSLYESKIQDYDNKLKAKDEEIYSQNEMLRINNTTGNRIRKSNKNEVVRLKAKGRGSARNISNHTCDSPSCDAVNVDLIRCCVCLNYLCEKCSDV